MKVFVIDDEKPAREELSWLLEQCQGVEVIGQAASAEAARQALGAGGEADAEVDLVFLDIDMPGIGGMRLAELWRELEPQRRPMVVFATAYAEHAVDAFEVEAVDYLLKPVRLARLQQAIDRARQRRAAADAPRAAASDSEASSRPLSRISVEDDGVYRVVPTDEIRFFEADRGIVVADTACGRYITDFSLKFLEENLAPETFFRCHRSYIVRLDAIESIAPWGAGTYRLILSRDDDVGVPLARSRAPELKALIPWSANVFEE